MGDAQYRHPRCDVLGNCRSGGGGGGEGGGGDGALLGGVRASARALALRWTCAISPIAGLAFASLYRVHASLQGSRVCPRRAGAATRFWWELASASMYPEQNHLDTPDTQRWSAQNCRRRCGLSPQTPLGAPQRSCATARAVRCRSKVATRVRPPRDKPKQGCTRFFELSNRRSVHHEQTNET